MIVKRLKKGLSSGLFLLTLLSLFNSLDTYGSMGLKAKKDTYIAANNVEVSNNAVDEESRKKEYGEFYVPLPSEVKEKDNVEVRGLYLNPDVVALSFSEENIEEYKGYIEGLKSGAKANDGAFDHINKLEKALAIAQATDINTLVIDIKNDSGYVAWESNIGIVNRLGAVMKTSQDDFKGLLDYMYKHNIHSIARIVVFKDYLLTSTEPEHAITLKDGKIFKDYANQAWLNPFDDYVWKYTVAISKEAALRGFNEVHFDYVRFPENAKDYNDIVDIKGRDDRPKDEAIKEFLAYAKKELSPYGIKVGAAIFGTTTTSWDDQPEDIGQTWRKIADNVDRISPMVYPSHYSEGWFGIKVPDTEPYKFIHGATLASLKKNALVLNPGEYTPWLQAFTADWVDGHIKYTPKVIYKQIEALQELGHNSYLMWNAGGDYLPQPYIQKRRESTIKEGNDLVNRSVRETIELYLNSLKDPEEEKDYTAIYTLTPVNNRPVDYDEFKYNYLNNDLTITSYTLEEGNENLVQKLTISYIKGDEVFNSVEMEIEVVNESGLYKVILPKEVIDFNKDL